jgi:hypothetical protein
MDKGAQNEGKINKKQQERSRVKTGPLRHTAGIEA